MRRTASRLRLVSLGLLLALALAGACLAAGMAFPPLTGRVVDDAHLLSPAAVQRLTQALAAHERDTGEQVIVATVPNLGGAGIEDYGYQLGRAWGIGQKGKDNGAILLVAAAEHRVRIEVGYGLEGTLTDARSKDIIEDRIVPAFKAGRMEAGIEAGTAAILAVLDGGKDADAAASTPAAPDAQAAAQALPAGGLAILLLVVFIMLFSFRAGPWFLLPMMLGSGGRGGGNGGDSFSGGGGSFGGGGASGSW